MQWPEDLEAIAEHVDRLNELDLLESRLKQTEQELAAQFAQISLAFDKPDGREPATLAADLLRQWMFIEKFLDDIEQQRMQWLEVLPS